MKYWMAFILLIILMGCSEKTDPKPYTYTRLFTGDNSKSWKIDKLIFKQAGKNDESLSLSSCEKDDQYIFYAGTERLFEVTNGTNKCSGDPNDDLLVTYTWAFNQAGASLSMVMPHIFGYFFIPFVVKEADSNNIKLEVYLDEEATISYEVNLKLIAEK